MARAKRWTIPFKSLGDTDCRIDIYEKDYTGTVETIGASSSQLVAAANPIFYEEDDNEDLLHVIRAKTGYINIVEKVYGAMQPLFSQTNDQHYVEFYYGSVLMFQGYLRAENFENAWESAPRTMSLPITSPLGLADGWTFEPFDENGMVTLGALLRWALEGLNTSYEYVIMPDDVTINAATPIELLVNKQLITPYGTEYYFGKGEMYDPITAEEFLEGFCRLFGCIVHDCGNTVVFQRVDYTGTYAKMEVSSLEDDGYTGTRVSYSATPVSLETLFMPCDDNSKESAVNPLKVIEVEYGEYEDNVKMDLTRSVPVGTGQVIVDDPDNPTTVVVLRPMTDEFQSNYYTEQTGTIFGSEVVRVVGDGDHEMLQVYVTSANVKLFTYTFVMPPLRTFGITFSTNAKNKTFEVIVKSGGKYFDANHDWVTTEARHTITTDDKGEALLASIGSLPGRTLEVSMLHPQPNGQNFVLKEMELNVYKGTPLDKYEGDNNPTTRFIRGTISDDEGDFDMLFHDAIPNQHRVVDGEDGRAVIDSDYPYMFRTQLRQKRSVWLMGTVDFATVYLPYYSAYGYTGNWRIIAVDFRPWDDEYAITIHNSTTFTT